MEFSRLPFGYRSVRLRVNEYQITGKETDMHKRVIITVLVLLAIMAPQIAEAQVDAKEAYASGKTLYAQGKFEQARDLFLKASFTDGRNAEVFLWLGKANYQIGEIDKAMKAWTQTLRLAPREAYAIGMLKALKGHTVKPDAKIKLIKTLIAEGMYTTASPYCQSLVRNEAATDAQRAEALRLSAQVLLETGKATSAIVALQEAAVKYPANQDKPTAALLLGRARVKMGGKSLTSGLELLKSVVVDFAKTPQAAAAQYELIIIGLSHKTDADAAEALKIWITANADHRLSGDATNRLISVYLSLAGQTAKPKPDAALGAFETQAITLASQQIATSIRTTEIIAAQTRILTHIEARYASVKAYGAAISGIELLMKAPLPKSGQLTALRAIGKYRTDSAIGELTDLARAGKLPAGATPDSLAAAAAAWSSIAKELPAYSAHADQGNLAQQVLALAKQLSWTGKIAKPRQPFLWSVQLALPAIQADDKTGAALVGVLLGHIDTYYTKRGATDAAITAASALLKAPLPQTARAGVLTAIAKLRSTQAINELTQLARAGKLPAGALPKSLAAAAAAWSTVGKEIPTYSAHVDQGNLAQQVLALAKQLSWTGKIAKPRQPFLWSVQLALPAIQADDKTGAALVGVLLGHIDTYYTKRGATAAAASATSTILKAPLPKTARAGVLTAIAQLRSTLAIKELTDLARAGKLPKGNIPKGLADAVTGYKVIMTEFPLKPTWTNLASLAAQANSFASRVPFPPKVTAPKAPHRWAMAIALDVIKADADTKAVASALATINSIESQYATFTEDPARGIALDIHAKLLAAVPQDNSAWTTLMTKQIDLLNAYASQTFNDNIKAGLDSANKTLTEHQNRMLATMSKTLDRDAAQAPAMLTRLTAHLAPWLARGHYDLVRMAYGTLATMTPAPRKLSVQLVITSVWVVQANAVHTRLLTAGFIVPRKLDPSHIKALEECYAMQDQRGEKDPIVLRARTIIAQIVKHYTDLEYFDIAAQAISVKSKKPVDTADAFAQIMLAGFHLQRAQAELTESLKRYKAKDKIALTDAFKKAIADYKKFITDRPTHSYVPAAIQSIYGIARIFEHYEAYDVAIGVYKDFAAFAAKSKVLSQGSPTVASEAETAELIVANALYSKARNVLSKTLSDRKPNDPPPAKINKEFTAAIDAYKAFIKARPASPLVGSAIARISKTAMHYVSLGSWDVAEGVFANLLAAGLDIRRPERLEFSRGLCHLGKVMPAHAKDVLAALTAPKRPGKYGGKGKGRGVSGLALAGGWSELKLADPTSTPKPVVKTPSPTKPASPIGQATGRANGGKAYRPDVGADDITEETEIYADADFSKNDILAMAAIKRQNISRVSRIARLRDEEMDFQYAAKIESRSKAVQKEISQSKRRMIAIPVLSDAEIARQEKFLALAYGVFQSIRGKYPQTTTADQARGEIMVMVGHWRSIAKWSRSAAMIERFLADNPTDIEMPTLRLSIARDYLSWAAQPVKTRTSTQEMLTEVAGRFGKARTQLEAIVADLPDEKTIVHEAQWAIANSFLTQARVVNAFSATLARGQYVRAGRELLKVAAKFHDHPQIGTIPQMLWTISGELSSRGYHNEAIVVCTDLTNHYPTNALATQASLKIAQIYQNNLRRPLRAAEAYIELNFARGGNDASAQAAMFQIGTQLKTEKRWVEALHVLESFVDSFPLHAQAGQALTTVGQIHQANEAWEDAIAAYKRVITEFAGGVWVREAKWSIAECTINLSRWPEASEAYRDYLKTYAANIPPVSTNKAPTPPRKDPRLAEAVRRLSVLKDLTRYQVLVDEKGQRKAFDAQYQIAAIVASQLSNPVKAIIEYRKVTANWPASHFADDALFKVGTTYLAMNETVKARKALLSVGEKYPNSPLADDALYMVGQSYETEAASLGAVTRASTISKQRDLAQKLAYGNFARGRRQLDSDNKKRIAQFKAGKDERNAELEMARGAIQTAQFNISNATIMANLAEQQVVVMSAKQLADRQDKINASLRLAVASYRNAAGVAAADKADESLLRMATIYAERLKDADAAMKTYLEIVRQFSGTSVAEDASWRIAQYYEKQGKADDAISAYKAFLRNYRRSVRADSAQFAIAENYEHAGKWVEAMDAYTNYMTNFPKGPMVAKAKEQISWIKTYRL
jgi:TolA-binding protein